MPGFAFPHFFQKKVMSIQQEESIPVVSKHFSPQRRGVIEPRRLQARTTCTEHKTALVHQSSKQYRGEFLILLNCHLETIHHPLLKLSRGGWVTSRDSHFMCKLWWEHVYCCATCAWYHSFPVSKWSERITKRRRDLHCWNELTLSFAPPVQHQWVRAHMVGCEQGEQGKKYRSERMGKWLHSFLQCAVTRCYLVDFALWFCGTLLPF